MARLVTKKSSVPGKAPSSSDLVMGELAVNVADKVIYTKDANGNIITLGGGAPPDATYLTLTTNATLTNERVLTPSTEFTVTDGGSGGNYSLSVNAISGKKIQGRTVYSKTTVNCGIIIPFYQYPSNVYTNASANLILDLKRKYQDVVVTVVLNPSSGPGTETDGNYTALIKRLLGAGITVLAYVYTSYGSRPITDIQNDINTYLNLYSFSSVNGQYGIFLDEMSTSNSSSMLTYYKSIKEYAHNLGLYPVFGNPGADLPADVFINESCDDYLIYEDNKIWPTEDYLKGDFYDGHSDFDYSQRYASILNVPFDAEKIQMMAKYCGGIYVTDAPFNSAYSVLPSYLENLFVMLSNKTAHKNLGLFHAAQINMLMP
jgi:hypothetical protein